MSIQAVAWALEQPIPDPAAKLVLVSLANAYNQREGRCFPTVRQIMKEACISERGVPRKIKVLVDGGFVRVEASFDGTGRQRANEYILVGFGKGATGDRGEGANCGTPLKEPEEIPEERVEADASTERAQARAAIEREFHDAFWPEWPNKTAKDAALRAWPGARAKADLQTIMDGVRNYVRGKPPDRNWMNPATFLNGARWNDHHPPPISQRGNHVQPRKSDLDDRLTDAFADRRARRGLCDPQATGDRRELGSGGVSDRVLTLGRGDYRDASGR